MLATCPVCGTATPTTNGCGCCAPLRPAPCVCPLSPEAPLYLSAEQAGRLTHPEASVTVRSGRHDWRLHWIDAAAWPAWRQRIRRRATCRLAGLAPARVVEDEAGVWVAVVCRGQRLPPWWEQPAPDPLAEVARLLTFLRALATALTELHEHGWFWLNFDPAELETPFLRPDQLHFTNLDVTLFPFDQATADTPIPPGFVAPELMSERRSAAGPATDVYRLGLFAYYWLARLLPRGFVGGGPAAFGFELPPLRLFMPALPFGVPTVLADALRPSPAQRLPTPAAFCDALARALNDARRCATVVGPLAWQVGGHTRTGRTKAARGGVNEDQFLVRRLQGPERALAAVADGITSCAVGSGTLASQMTCAALDATVTADWHRDRFTADIARVCRGTAEALVAWALANGHGPALAEGQELMGSTLTAAWLQGRAVTLANLGDSRAYLIRNGRVEQLTVDGDVGSSLVVAGVAPEGVRDLGGMAGALRDCIGGCTRDAAGRPIIHEQFCKPSITTWPLQPGDVLVLCTDGLVDEGYFLEPVELAALVAAHAALSAEELAWRLAEAADALQRPPSPEEPLGCGDNISCIVIKVAASIAEPDRTG